MNETEMILLAGGICTAALLIVWSVAIGRVRGTLAWICRVLWTFPFVACFFPETVTESLPRTFATRNIHVLLDDSQSMHAKPEGLEETPSERAATLLKELGTSCEKLGCQLQVSPLSRENKLVGQGYTPLSQSIEPWLFRTGRDPWIVISDGGDFQPTLPWSKRLAGAGRGAPNETIGLIVNVGEPDAENIWIDEFNVPPFSFEGKPLVVDLVLKRQTKDLSSQNVQVQLVGDSGILTTVNSNFIQNTTEAAVSITVPSFKRGNQLLTAKILPTAKEVSLWDNEASANIEVLPNTVGVLHLLGSPSWDGRFLRRYFKSEPKYDLISFFILRDPWDSQHVNERELSLIPFPVQRLFNEELPNFRVLIVQNFTLVQFLLPEYQENLVKFVKSGGGVLFVGGPRAFQMQDLQNSPLRQILPFSVDDLDQKSQRRSATPISPGANPMNALIDGEGPLAENSGPSYDENMPFRIELAEPDSSKRMLANVYEDWQDLGPSLRSLGELKGLHRMDRVKFKKDDYTPLLTASTPGGVKFPLAVASYPQNGRALWLFTDQMWHMSMDTQNPAAHQSYSKFFHSAMTWLLRQDLKQPLIVNEFRVTRQAEGDFQWSFEAQGPAVRFLEIGDKWQIRVCNQPIARDHLQIERLGPESWRLSGDWKGQLGAGERCQLEVEGKNAAFGSVKTHAATIIPRIYLDRELGGSVQKLRQLANLTGAKGALDLQKLSDDGQDWLASVTGSNGVALPPRYKTMRNFYWPFDRWWMTLLLLAMPLEVVVRRWHLIFGTRFQGVQFGQNPSKNEVLS